MAFIAGMMQIARHMNRMPRRTLCWDSALVAILLIAAVVSLHGLRCKRETCVPCFGCLV